MLQANGFAPAGYNVLTRNITPQEKAKLNIPAIAIKMFFGMADHRELSSLPGQKITYLFDVFATVPQEVDMILSKLMDFFYEGSQFTIWNMSNSEPIAVGNYTGLTSVGSMEIDSASYRGNEVPEIVSDNRFLYEGFFTIEVKMPKL
jgi:hypothetical protein